MPDHHASTLSATSAIVARALSMPLSTAGELPRLGRSRAGARGCPAAPAQSAERPAAGRAAAAGGVHARKFRRPPAQAVAAVRALGDVRAHLRTALLADHEQIGAGASIAAPF